MATQLQKKVVKYGARLVSCKKDSMDLYFLHGGYESPGFIVINNDTGEVHGIIAYFKRLIKFSMSLEQLHKIVKSYYYSCLPNIEIDEKFEKLIRYYIKDRFYGFLLGCELRDLHKTKPLIENNGISMTLVKYYGRNFLYSDLDDLLRSWSEDVLGFSPGISRSMMKFKNLSDFGTANKIDVEVGKCLLEFSEARFTINSKPISFKFKFDTLLDGFRISLGNEFFGIIKTFRLRRGLSSGIDIYIYEYDKDQTINIGPLKEDDLKYTPTPENLYSTIFSLIISYVD